MIVSVTIRGFKSLGDFSIDFGKFNCLVGLNGAGKSSILQALDFACHLMKGDMNSWLARRGWNAQDLHSKFTQQSNVVIFVKLKTPEGKWLEWKAAFNRSTLNCTREQIILLENEKNNKELIFNLFKGRYSFGEKESSKIEFIYKGSILSSLKDETLSSDILYVKKVISGILSLELLSPHLMRTTPRDATDDIGVGGEKLSPFLYGIKGEDKERLVKNLKKFYPSVIDYKVKQERAGWKRLYLIEEFNGQRIETEAKHVNDGLLRILAILAQADSERSILLFDEIENGVNPEIVERLVEVLTNAPQQIVVTTHSPLILNYLDDKTAEKSVKFIYRSAFGGTKSTPLFGIPRIKEKLKFMGPGEAFIDTKLSELNEECIKVDIAREAMLLEDAE